MSCEQSRGSTLAIGQVIGERLLGSPWRYVLSLALALAMLATVVWFADPGELVQKLSRVNLLVMLLLIGSYLATVWFRALRYRLLLEPSASTRDWFVLTAQHNFFFTFVPFKLGEASLLPLAGRRGIPMTDSASALVLCRVFEFGVLLLFGLAGSLSLGLATPLVPALLLLFGASVFATQFGRLALGLARVSAWLQRVTGWKWAVRSETAFEAIWRWFGKHQHTQRKLLLLTVLVCALAALSVYLAFLAVEVDLAAGEVLFLYAGLAVLGALGVLTVAGIGVSDLGLAGLLVLLGFSLGQATIFALVARFLLLAASLLGTAAALAYRRRAVRTDGAESGSPP